MRGRAVAVRCVLCYALRAMDKPLREGWAGE